MAYKDEQMLEANGFGDIEYFEVGDDTFPEDNIPDTMPDDYVSDKVRLSERINLMSPNEKEMFIKTLQMDMLTDLSKSMKNLKKTSKEEWERVINRMNSLKELKVNSEDGKKFYEKFKKLIPLVAAFAAMMLAFRDFEKKNSEAAEPENNPLDDEAIQKLSQKTTPDSIILTMCRNKENGYSL